MTVALFVEPHMVAIRPGTSGIVAAAAAFSSAFSSSVAGCGSLGASFLSVGSSYANAAASSFGAGVGAGGSGCTLSPVAATLILSTGAAGP